LTVDKEVSRPDGFVLHGKAPPFARRRFDDPAPVQVEAASTAAIRRIQFERRILTAVILESVTLAGPLHYRGGKMEGEASLIPHIYFRSICRT
jgi:hypothetical protein